MFELNVKIDVASQVSRLNKLRDTLGDEVLADTLNRTMQGARTKMVENITRTYNIAPSRVRLKLVLLKASRARRTYTATLLGNERGAKGRSLNMKAFLTNKTTRIQKRAARLQKAFGGRVVPVLQFQVIRGGGSKQVPGAFIIRGGKFGGEPVFIRDDRPGSWNGIRPLQTIDVPQMFEAHKVQDPVQAWIRENFARLFEQRANYWLAKYR